MAPRDRHVIRRPASRPPIGHVERSEGALRRLLGRTDRSMLDLYDEDLQDERAFEVKRRRGNVY